MSVEKAIESAAGQFDHDSECERRKVSEWMPIESAPRDGTPILVYLREKHVLHSWGRVRIARWKNGAWHAGNGSMWQDENLALWSILPTPNPCKHEGWSFEKHGRCCFKCNAFVVDFGD